jgi:hypothetical protein
MTNYDKIVRFGGECLLILYIGGKLVKQVEIWKKGFFNLLNHIKIP